LFDIKYVQKRLNIKDKNYFMNFGAKDTFAFMAKTRKNQIDVI